MVLQREANHTALKNLKAEALERGHVPRGFEMAPEHCDAEEVPLRVAGGVRSADSHEEIPAWP